MKKSFALIACLLLAGCSDADWNQALNDTGMNQVMNYAGMGGSDDASADTVQPVTPAATTAAAPSAPGAVPNSDLCKAVATQDATSGGFDPATQQRVFARSYSQCVAIYTR